MSFQNSSGVNNGQANVSQLLGAQQKQKLLELTEKYKALVTEAKSVGENTAKGKELLMNASRLRAYCENYNRQVQQAAQAYNQNRNSAATGASASNSSSATSANISGGQNAAAGNAGAQNRSAGSQLANFIRQVLTPEQNQQHDALSQSFQTKLGNIRDKAAYLQQHIVRLSQEINKQTEGPGKKQLEEKKAELTNNLRMLRMEYNVQQTEFQNRKKKFYVECARNNPDLHRLLQRSTQQQQQQQQAHAQASNVSSASNAESGMVGTPKVDSSPAVGKVQVQGTPGNITTQKLPQQNIQRQQSASESSAKVQSQVTNVNAAASMVVNNGANKSAIFKQSDPSVPISETVNVKIAPPVTYKTNRPSLTGGSAMNAAALNTPIMTKLPPYEVDTERVMSKRKLRELVKSVGIDEGDGETVIDGDVEELLLDLADDFVSNVTGFACRLAKHRKSDNLETRDIQLHLERNWNIRIPGYSADEIRSTRKWNPTQPYNQKLQSINSEKAVSAKNSNVSSIASGKSASQK